MTGGTAHGTGRSTIKWFECMKLVDGKKKQSILDSCRLFKVCRVSTLEPFFSQVWCNMIQTAARLPITCHRPPVFMINNLSSSTRKQDQARRSFGFQSIATNVNPTCQFISTESVRISIYLELCTVSTYLSIYLLNVSAIICQFMHSSMKASLEPPLPGT